MKIAGTQFDVESSTLEIYVSGCTRGCAGCHNIELQSFSVGTPWRDYISRLDFQLSRPFTTNIALMGGEPLEQGRVNIEDLLTYIKMYNKYCPERKLWLYTGFEFCELSSWVLTHFDYVKCGSYDAARACSDYVSHGIKLASDNQRVYMRGVDY